MGVLTTTGVVGPAVNEVFSRRLLMRARQRVVHMMVAQKRTMPRKSGTVLRFRRIEALAHQTTPLTEGIPPTGKALSKTDVDCRVYEYGDYVTVTDFGRAVVEHPILRDATKVLGQQSGESMDVLSREVFVAGTTVFRGGNVANRTDLLNPTHRISTNILDRVIRQLEQQNAQLFMEMISPTEKVSTQAIRDAFWAIVGPEVKASLEKLPGYIPVANYPRQQQIAKGECGSYKHIRFVESTLAKSFPGGGGAAVGDVIATGGVADVFTILVFGEEAVGVVPLEGKNLENIIKATGSAGTADPLNQIATSGWKHTGGRVRLNEDFMVRIEVTAGDLDP